MQPMTDKRLSTILVSYRKGASLAFILRIFNFDGVTDMRGSSTSPNMPSRLFYTVKAPPCVMLPATPRPLVKLSIVSYLIPSFWDKPVNV